MSKSINSVLMLSTTILALSFVLEESAGDTSSGLIVLNDAEFLLGDVAAILSYDAVEDQFIGVTENVRLRDLTQNIDAIDDLTGSFTVSAGIDENGVLSSGTYVWTGGSADNGIPDDTLLMAGNLSLFNYPKFLRPEFIADVQFLHPDLLEIMGSVKTILWTAATSSECVPGGDPALNFTCSWILDNPSLVTTIYFFPFEYTDIDSDLDLVPNDEDNCTLEPNYDQVDTDQDSIGNRCDADFNQDCIVNFIDIALFSDEFLGSNQLYDLNSDGAVNFVDFSLVSGAFLEPPGPNFFDTCTIPILSDSFDTDSGNWVLGSEVEYQSFGGNPDGNLRYLDTGLNADSISLPSESLGSWGSYADTHIIVFDHLIAVGLEPLKPLEITIAGPHGVAKWTGPVPNSTSVWRRFTVPISSSAFEVTEGTWADILEDVSQVSLRVSGSETTTDQTRFDNFSIRKTFP